LTDFRIEPLKRAIQPFLMVGSDRLKLDADPVRTGPADDGTLNQDRRLVFGEIEEQIDVHTCGGWKMTFDPATFAREIQGSRNAMELILVAQGARK
jgi:hypothetical protein